MRKIFFLLFFIFLAVMPAQADFLPSYVNPEYSYGIGLLSIKDKLYIHELDDEKSNLSALILVGKSSPVIKIRGVKKPEEDSTFIAYKSEGDLAFLTVEQDNDNWYYVCYDQKRKLFGWVKKDENLDFISWHDFFNLYGRKNGVYVFKNVSENNKKLYSSPDKNSNVVDEFYIAKHISLWLISGDWMLVKVTTYDGITKTGWIKWRLDNGSIIMFPDFTN